MSPQVVFSFPGTNNVTNPRNSLITKGWHTWENIPWHGPRAALMKVSIIFYWTLMPILTFRTVLVT